MLAAPPIASGLDSAGPRAWLAGFVDLQHRRGEPDLRRLDARPGDEDNRGQIPGAVWIDVGAVEKIDGRPRPLADRAAWESWNRG